MLNASIATPVAHPFNDVRHDTPSFPPAFIRSFYLQSELDRLRDLSDAVRSSGSVAPANCWLVVEDVHRASHTYRYARLYVQPIAASKKLKKRSLGRPNCAQHLDWIKRIQRRVALYEIEQQMTLLTKLIDRQQTRPIEFQTDINEAD